MNLTSQVQYFFQIFLLTIIKLYLIYLFYNSQNHNQEKLRELVKVSSEEEIYIYLKATKTETSYLNSPNFVVIFVGPTPIPLTNSPTATGSTLLPQRPNTPEKQMKKKQNIE